MKPIGSPSGYSAFGYCWIGECPVSLAASGAPIRAASTSSSSRQAAKIEAGSRRSRRSAVTRRPAGRTAAGWPAPSSTRLSMVIAARPAALRTHSRPSGSPHLAVAKLRTSCRYACPDSREYVNT